METLASAYSDLSMVGRIADVQTPHQASQWELCTSLYFDQDNQQLSLSLQLVFLKYEGLAGDSNPPSHVELSQLDM